MTRSIQSKRKNYKIPIIYSIILFVFFGNTWEVLANIRNSTLVEKAYLEINSNQITKIDTQPKHKAIINKTKALAPCDISQTIGGNPIVFATFPNSPSSDTYQTFTAQCTGNISGIQLELTKSGNYGSFSVALQIFDSNGALIGSGLPQLTGTVPSGVYNFTFSPSDGAVVAGQTYYFKFSQIIGIGVVITVEVDGTNTSAYAGGSIVYSGGGISPTNDAKFLITIAEAALPVTLIAFSGKKTSENENVLIWKTSIEKNFSHFDVERSTNSKKFEKIVEIKSNESRAYEFNDSKPPMDGDVLYYRLKIKDLDGKVAYSKIISIENSIENSSIGQFYPNPSLDKVFIDVIATEKRNWTITTFDFTGKLINTEAKILPKGRNVISIEKLQKGINFIKFENGLKSEIRKVIQE